MPATIRDKIIKAKAPRRKRRPVMARSQEQAQSIRRRWALEDAIRDVNARVLTLADVVDRPERGNEGDAVSDLRARMDCLEREVGGDPPTIDGMEDTEWTFYPKAGWVGLHIPKPPERSCMAQYSAIVTEAYQVFFRAVQAANAERDGRRSELLENNCFYVPAAIAGTDDGTAYATTVTGLDRDTLLSLIDAECEGTIETAEAIYDAQIERALALLRAQEAALDAFEVLPTAEEYQGFLAVYDDGRIKWSLTKP